MGMNILHSLDIWSFGCILYEIYKSKVLFTGENNFQMIVYQVKFCGSINRSMFLKCIYFRLYRVIFNIFTFTNKINIFKAVFSKLLIRRMLALDLNLRFYSRLVLCRFFDYINIYF